MTNTTGVLFQPDTLHSPDMTWAWPRGPGQYQQGPPGHQQAHEAARGREAHRPAGAILPKPRKWPFDLSGFLQAL